MCVFMVLDYHLFNDTKIQNNFHICKYLHEYFKEKVEIILNEFSVLFKTRIATNYPRARALLACYRRDARIIMNYNLIEK